MRKTVKIVLYFLGSLILLIVLIIAFHDPIISFALRRAISNASEGGVELKMDRFRLDIIEESIVIDKPEILFKDVYLNETKSIQLNRVTYDKIEVDLLHLKELILDQSIIASAFIIDKPVFWISEMGTEAKSSFHPEKIIEALNHNPDAFSRINIQIQDIEIHYGSVKLSQYTSPEADPGLVDFTIMLRNFKSQPDSTDPPERILFSDEFLFKLKNFSKKLKSGYQLDIDSAVFSSRHRDLIIGGVSLLPVDTDKGKNAIALHTGQLVLKDIGLQEVRGLEDLSLSSVKISNGYFTNYQSVERATKKTDDPKEGMEQLAKLFYQFTLDTISIDRFQYHYILNGNDTAIFADDIEFMVSGIEIDSGMFADPLRDLLYDKIVFETGTMEVKYFIPDLKLRYDHLAYSTDDNNLKISGIMAEGDSTETSPELLNLKLKELDIKGFSLKKFQKQQTQNLSITIINPDINLDLGHKLLQSQSSGNKPIWPKHLVLEKIIVQNGAFDVFKTGQFNATLDGFNLAVNQLRFPDNENPDFQYSDVAFNYEKGTARFEDKKFDFTSGRFSYIDQELQIDNIGLRFSTGAAGDQARFNLKNLQLLDFGLKNLLFENELYVSAINLKEPRTTGSIFLNSGAGKQGQAEQSGFGIPMDMNIGAVNIVNGNIGTILRLPGESINISGDYAIRLGQINLTEGDSIKTLIDDLLWEVQLSNLDIGARDHFLHLDELVTDAFKSQFRFNNLEIYSTPDSNNNPQKIELKKLSLPYFGVTGLDYRLLIKYDSIALRSLRIDHPDINLVLPKVKKIAKVNTSEKLDVRKYLFFSYDTIHLNNLYLNIENPGDSSHTIVKLEDFNFTHRFSQLTDANLVNNIGFEFGEFSFIDTVAGSHLRIKKGYVDSEKEEITIEGIEGGNLGNRLKKQVPVVKSSVKFRTSKISFSGVYIKEALPSQLRISKMAIGDLDLKLVRTEKKGPKMTFKFDLEMLRRFSNVLTKLRVDSAMMGDISFHYKTLSDTSSHTIEVDSIGVYLNEIAVDTSMIGESQPDLISKLTIDLKGRTRVTRDSLYEIQTGRLHYDFPNHRITIDSVYVRPRFVDSVFFEKAVYQTDRLKLFGRKVDINDINIDELLLHDLIHAGSIDLYDFHINMYRDKRYPFKPGLYKKMPRESLLGIAQKFTVDSLHIFNSYLEYKEYGEKSESPGEIFFDEFNVTGYNLTNNLKPDDKTTTLKLKLNARIMGETRMDASVYFPLFPHQAVFWLTAKSEKIDMASLNSMTENLLGIGILRGTGSVDIPLISANDSISKGSMTFRYKKLRLAMYDRKKESIKTGFLSPLINFMINDLVVKSNNPKFARKPRIGQVYFKRDTRKGIVNYVWKGILSGMLSTLGFNNKEQRQERKEMKSEK